MPSEVVARLDAEPELGGAGEQVVGERGGVGLVFIGMQFVAGPGAEQCDEGQAAGGLAMVVGEERKAVGNGIAVAALSGEPR